MSISNYINTVIEGDCLEVMNNFPDKSINMILCDLPYGITQNDWDIPIDFNLLWNQYERIISDTGNIVLTSQGIFTAKIISSNYKLFKYKIVWIKSKSTNFLNAKKQPLRKHEDICIFYKNKPTYNPQFSDGMSYDKGFRKDSLTGSYGNFNSTHSKGENRYPVDVISYDYENEIDFFYCKTSECEGEVLHPTQKPVELGKYLIKTFSNKGDIILDNACGSGSFLVSAKLEGRNFIGIEKNKNMFFRKNTKIDFIQVCNQRLKNIM